MLLERDVVFDHARDVGVWIIVESDRARGVTCSA
jgi:hypothetical protein